MCMCKTWCLCPTQCGGLPKRRAVGASDTMGLMALLIVQQADKYGLLNLPGTETISTTRTSTNHL
jgi:hypothetical protein